MKIEAFHNTVKSSFWGIMEKVFMLLCAFAVRTVIAYKLGAEFVGLDGLFASILTLLNLSELGLGSAIVFSMGERDYGQVRGIRKSLSHGR